MTNKTKRVLLTCIAAACAVPILAGCHKDPDAEPIAKPARSIESGPAGGPSSTPAGGAPTNAPSVQSSQPQGGAAAGPPL